MPTTTQDLNKIELIIFNKSKKVFSGRLKDLAKFSARDQTADRVNFLNSDGSFIMSMKYHDFKKIVVDQLG